MIDALAFITLSILLVSVSIVSVLTALVVGRKLIRELKDN